ncbi:hypothetical protein [Geodermatophilus sp. SYSU D00815]
MTVDEENLFARLPAGLLARAESDRDFALALLHEETRAGALADPELGLPVAEQRELFPVLGRIAQLSFEDAVEQIRDASVVDLG